MILENSTVEQQQKFEIDKNDIEFIYSKQFKLSQEQVKQEIFNILKSLYPNLKQDEQ